ncbi:Phospholipase/lecithinase/hemolysin [Desulfurella amilsii]|uniref:Phospholipase/lecithinase/hemolysin n=1 Tax=Desulfurella amilsii TaxID=1562698 RepID=A0A1X4XUF7_9BACT|nr:autotransporter domain-containing protein [Desulfurella amilsii]OSS41169.1 Phospholipase/lecithinase/hemolysin [Desulfurella amilsii]
MLKNKSKLIVFLLIFLILANVKYAQAFGNWYVFGDSLSDNGNIPKLTGYPLPPLPYVGNRFSNGPVWAEDFPIVSNFSFIPSNDFSVGGAFTGPLSAEGLNGQPGTFNNLENTAWSSFAPLFTTPQLPSFLTEIQQFAASGGRFKSSDLAGVWIGANNFFVTANQAATLQQYIAGQSTLSDVINSGISPTMLSQINSVYTQTGDVSKAMSILIGNAVQTAVPQVAQGITEMSMLGAKQVVVLTLPPIQDTPSAIQGGAQAQALAAGYTQLYNTYLQQALSSVHNQTGLNIITLNGEVLFKELVSNPGAYGIVNINEEGMQAYLNGDPNYSYYLFWDGVHPTAYTHSIIAQYVSSAVKNFYSLTVPARLIEANADAFSSLINNRIETFIGDNSSNQAITNLNDQNGGPNFYITGNYNSGWRDDSDSTIGFNYNISTFALGADYWINPNLLIGASIGYGNNYASLNDSAGTLEANVYQLALYSLYKLNNFFLNAQLDYGLADFTKISHPGVISSISNSSVKGNYLNLSANGGYIFKLNNFSFIPSIGISATNTSIHSYDLTGDPALNMSVDRQNLSLLLGTVGLKVNYEASLGAMTIIPSVSVEMKSKLNGAGGEFDSYFQDEPSIALTSKYPDYSRNWGVVKVGVDALISNKLSANINYSSTFDKKNSTDHSIWAQVGYKF